MMAFLVVSILLIASQTGMFVSPVYRLTFNTWSYFGTLTIAAYVMLVITFFMAIVARCFFGRGLAHFLQVQDALERCDFTPVYFDRGSVTSTIIDEKQNLPWDPQAESEAVVKRMSIKLMSEEPPENSGAPVPVAPMSLPFKAQRDFVERARRDIEATKQSKQFHRTLIITLMYS